MPSAEVVCCKLLPNITDELSIEANRVDPDRSSLIWVRTVCHRVFLNISAEKQTTFVAIGALRVNGKI